MFQLLPMLIGLPWINISGIQNISSWNLGCWMTVSYTHLGDNSKKDIHESNLNYLLNCRKAALYAAEKLGWTVIPCSDSQQPYTIETISEQIKRIIGK